MAAPQLAFSQAVIEWQRCLGGRDSDDGYDFEETPDGGFIVVGSAVSNDGDVSGNHGSVDVWVVKLDSLGNLVWQKCLGGTGWEDGFGVKNTSDGGYIVVGRTDSNDGDVTGFQGGASDCWVVKLSNSGNLQWQRTFGGTSHDEARSVLQTADGGYMVSGFTFSNNGDVNGNHGDADYWVFKLGPTGNMLWQKCFGGSSRDSGGEILQCRDGGFVVSGISSSNDGDVTGNHGSSDYWIIKIDTAGNIQWQKSLGGSLQEQCGWNSIVQTSDDGYMIAGYSKSANGDVTAPLGHYDYWMARIDSSGNLVWQRSMGGSAQDDLHAVGITSDNGFVFAGTTFSTNGDVSSNNGGRDFWLVCLDSQHNLLWKQNLGGSANEVPFAVQQTTDGGYVVVGVTVSNDGDVSGNHGTDSDRWVVKLRTNVSVAADEENHPSIGPKVCRGSSGLTIEDVSGSRVRVYDLQGRLLIDKTLLSEKMNLSTETLANAWYILRIDSENGDLVTKFRK